MAHTAYPLTVGTTLDRDTARLSPVDVAPGQVYETSGGERVHVVRDDRRGAKVLLVRYPDREATATEAHMSRYSFADMATFDGFTLVSTDGPVEIEADEDAPADMAGTFHGPVRCPVCSRFMALGFDGHGLPAATCSRPDCGMFMDASELIDSGRFEVERS